MTLGVDDKGMKSKMASMVAFVKKTDSPSNAAILASRGQERMEYLLKYLVHAMRKHKTSSTVSNSHTVDDKSHVDHHQWSQYEMEKAVGKAKSDLWIASGKLTWVPDRVTGSEKEDCIFYVDVKTHINKICSKKQIHSLNNSKHYSRLSLGAP